MSKKYNYNYYEGCGCCFGNSTVEIDTDRMRVVKHDFSSVQGGFISSCEVLAVIKNR